MCRVILKLNAEQPGYYEKVQKDVSSSPPEQLRVGSEIETEAGTGVVEDVLYDQGTVIARFRLKDKSRVSELNPAEWRNLP